MTEGDKVALIVFLLFMIPFLTEVRDNLFFNTFVRRWVRKRIKKIYTPKK